MTICKLASYTINTIILIVETFLVVLLILFLLPCTHNVLVCTVTIIILLL